VLSFNVNESNVNELVVRSKDDNGSVLRERMSRSKTTTTDFCPFVCASSSSSSHLHLSDGVLVALRRLQRIVEPRPEPLPRPRSRRLKRPQEPRSRDAVDRGVGAAVEDKLLVAVDNVGGHGVLVGFVAQLQLG
jgi:hypothetical protein